MSQPLRSLTVEGFASIQSLTLELTSEVTLLVGANGSGKSNIVNAFELLGRIVDGQLNDHFLRSGGLSRYLHKATSSRSSAHMIALETWGTEHDGLSNGYRAGIVSAPDDQALVSETLFFHDAQKHPEPYSRDLGLAKESQLKAHAHSGGMARFVLEALSGCRVFHFDDTSADAPQKRFCDVADNLTLHPDARNLAALLLAMRDEEPACYRKVIRTIRTVAPFFDDFVLEPVNQRVLLRWRERGIDGVFSADTLSDGTLRFVSLCVLLLQPNAPSTIVLDEPELGLHPFAIHQLASLLQSAATGRRIVAATQSVTLLSQFSIDEVAVVDRTSHGTTVRRPDPEELIPWLEDYSLGELWEKNVLGGRPAPDAPSTVTL